MSISLTSWFFVLFLKTLFWIGLNKIDKKISSPYIRRKIIVDIMIQQILRAFDLNEKEIKVFRVCLELGNQPASNIARVLELPRNTARFTLDALVAKGLMRKTNRGNTQFYSPESKKNLVRHLKVKQMRYNEKVDAQIKLIETFGKALDAQENRAKGKPKITFYEGNDGLERVYEHTLSSREEICSWASFDDNAEALPEYFDTYYTRRAKKKIPIKSIHPDSALARENTKRDKEEMRTSLLVDPEKYNWVPEIQVYDDFINIASWHEKFGVIIESPEIAEAMKSIFDLCFQPDNDVRS